MQRSNQPPIQDARMFQDSLYRSHRSMAAAGAPSVDDGQFLDHDITFDPASLKDPPASPNLRTPFFDLDSVYGRGPDRDRVLYDRTGELARPTAARFLIDFDAARDLPRTSQQRSITADPRNDENVIISKLHLAFLRFHMTDPKWAAQHPDPSKRVLAAKPAKVHIEFRTQGDGSSRSPVYI